MAGILIIYDTLYGNTEKVAMALMEGMKEKKLKVELAKASQVEVGKLGDYDLLAFGAPTHAFGISKSMRALLGKISPERVQARRAFAFDTRISKWWTGSAAKKIEKQLMKLGMIMVKPYQSAAVVDKEGPLAEGVERVFQQIGRDIAELVK